MQNSDKNQEELGGYSYYVTDDQLRRYLALSVEQRLAWAEAARYFTLAGQTEETKKYHQALREGGNIG